MFLFLLAGCFESTNERLLLRFDMARKTGSFDAVYTDVSFDMNPEDRAALTAASAVAKLVEERQEALDRLAGATVSTARFDLHDGTLDLVLHAEAPLSWFVGDRGESVRLGVRLSLAEQTKGRPGRPAIVVWAQASPTGGLDVTGKGAWSVLRFVDPSSSETAEVWTLERGRAELQVLTFGLGEDGKPEQAVPWIGAVPGLTEAIDAAGLLK
ncbi:MAG: hypothetical protein EXR71_00430 [Myxococcales bacterium]|nr:hypothetical protein [Myxococcales bacterium]